MSNIDEAGAKTDTGGVSDAIGKMLGDYKEQILEHHAAKKFSRVYTYEGHKVNYLVELNVGTDTKAREVRSAIATATPQKPTMEIMIFNKHRLTVTIDDAEKPYKQVMFMSNELNVAIVQMMREVQQHIDYEREWEVDKAQDLVLMFKNEFTPVYE